MQDDNGGDPGYVSKQLWFLYDEMQPGDTVFAYGNDQILDWGEVTGDYVYKEDDFQYPHRRLLSVLESGRDAEGWTNEPLRLVDTEEAPEELPPKELRLPPNLYVVGTVNVDETTRAFSPKVLDRAFSLELSDVDFTDYREELGDGSTELSDTERQDLLAAFTQEGTFVRVDKETIAAHETAHPEARELLQNLNAQLGPTSSTSVTASSTRS